MNTQIRNYLRNPGGWEAVAVRSLTSSSGSETKSVLESEAVLEGGLQPGLETSPTSWCAQLSVDI